MRPRAVRCVRGLRAEGAATRREAEKCLPLECATLRSLKRSVVVRRRSKCFAVPVPCKTGPLQLGRGRRYTRRCLSPGCESPLRRPASAVFGLSNTVVYHATARTTHACSGIPLASLVKMRPCTGLRADLVGRAHAVVQEVDGSECIRCRPQIRRDNPLNLSISLSGGKETNRDSPSSCERNGTEPSTESPVLAGGREMWCMGGDVLGCLRRCKSP